MARAPHERSPQSNAEPLRTSAAGTANYIYINNAPQTRWINPRSNRNNRYASGSFPRDPEINAVWTQLISISSSHPSLPLNFEDQCTSRSLLPCCRGALSCCHDFETNSHHARCCLLPCYAIRPPCYPDFSPSSALSLGMCICCVPMSPTYLPARILYVRVIFSDPRIRGGIGLVGCSGILGKNITRVLSNLPSCKMHPATTTL
jgi:hypothetical protein